MLHHYEYDCDPSSSVSGTDLLRLDATLDAIWPHSEE